MRALITGGTGLIGGALAARLGDATITSRSADRAGTQGAGRRIQWDGRGALAPEPLAGIDTVFHLAGEPVAEGRWSDEKKRAILDSRVIGTRSLVDSLGAMARPPAVLVAASAVGIYGTRGDEPLTEESAPGTGFLVEVCQAWEAEAARATRFGMRVVSVRIGIVLSLGGGALSKMLPLFKLGVAGRLGSGAQWMPWIHVEDAISLLRHAAETPSLNGPMNVTAPQPVTNSSFTHALARAVHRPARIPAPLFALKLAFGELASVVLASQRVIPERALSSGYVFRYPELESALGDLFPASEVMPGGPPP